MSLREVHAVREEAIPIPKPPSSSLSHRPGSGTPRVGECCRAAWKDVLPLAHVEERLDSLAQDFDTMKDLLSRTWLLGDASEVSKGHDALAPPATATAVEIPTAAVVPPPFLGTKEARLERADADQEFTRAAAG